MSKSIKGTQTEKNLLTSFAGESQARMRYTYFASVAKKEGYEQISAIFTETADQEKEHAKRMFKFLEGGMVEITASYPAGVIGTTLENLQAAAAGEHEEWSLDYPHFADVADAVDVPVILYNVPGRTGCSIPVETVARLARHPNICGIKEASGDISYAVKIARYLSDDFQMFCGNDDITLPLLSLGASGVISVWANIMPAACHQMVTDYLEGRREQALKAQLKYLDLINGLFTEVNPIPVKEAMNLMGMDVGGYRLPLCPMSSEHREKLAGIMRQAGLDVK